MPDDPATSATEVPTHACGHFRIIRCGVQPATPKLPRSCAVTSSVLFFHLEGTLASRRSSAELFYSHPSLKTQMLARAALRSPTCGRSARQGLGSPSSSGAAARLCCMHTSTNYARQIHPDSTPRVEIDEGIAIRRFNMLSASRLRESEDSVKRFHSHVMRLNDTVSRTLSEQEVSAAIEGKARTALFLCSTHPDEGLTKSHLLKAQRNMMVVLAGQSKLEDAIEIGERTLDGFHQLLGPLHPSTVSLLRELSVIVLSSGDLVLAEPLLREAADRCTNLFGEVHPDSLTSNMLLGQLLATRGQLAEASTRFRSNLATARALYGDGSSVTNVAASNLSALLMERRQFWQAEGILTWQLRLVSRLHGRSSAMAREVAFRLAQCKLASGDDSINIWPERIAPADVFGVCSDSACARAV